ncbi:hypothetical protein Naga_100177g18 [Nannochloropsis gaditana]|uniref:Uncharacterized protein n=1 Tax=Nannochloropsis gaditana TaxID=72520 RepID=W7TNE6_9STRA|nr:hypothetical protein Naga_100177g18 [Nannochloropsis gaditana]
MRYILKGRGPLQFRTLHVAHQTRYLEGSGPRDFISCTWVHVALFGPPWSPLAEPKTASSKRRVQEDLSPCPITQTFLQKLMLYSLARTTRRRPTHQSMRPATFCINVWMRNLQKWTP